MFANVKKCVIPVAGLGTRLLPLTRSIPKELLPLGRLPVLQHVVDELQQIGVDSQVLVTCERKRAISEYFTDTESQHVGQVQFVEQLEQKGLGHAVLCAREAIGNESFFIALGDAVIKQNTVNETLCERMRRLCDANEADAAIAFHRVPPDKVNRYGVAEVGSGFTEGDEFFTLKSVVEKPAVESAPSRYAIAARYLCKPDLFRYLSQTQPGQGGEIQLTDALQMWMKDGATVIGVPLAADEKRFDIGNFESYYTAAMEYALSDHEFGSALTSQLIARSGGT